MGLYSFFNFNIQKAIYFAIFTGISYGICMSIIMGTLHIFCVAKLGYGLSKKTITVKQTRYFDLMMTYEQAFNLCVMSLGVIRKSQLRQQNLFTGEISAHVHANKKNWGYLISFNISPLSKERTQIEVTSRPTLSTQLVDCGQNLKNVEKIVTFLTLFPEIPPSSSDEE